jgi:hypothetical protein
MNSRMQFGFVRGLAAMNSIERELAAAFFADLLLPLRHANLRRGIRYLDRSSNLPSYWGEVVSRTGGLERLSKSACDASVLLDLLCSYWQRNREPDLPQLLPYLERLRQDLIDAGISNKPSEPEPLEFVYPLF